MARGVNKVILIGHLGADPDIRYTANGTPVANLRLATTEVAMVGEGKWEERTEWHRVVAFGKVAENCGTFLSKGRQIYVEGRIQTRQWDDQQGNKRYSTEIVAREIQFLGGGGGGEDRSAQAPRGGQSPSPAGTPSSYSNRSQTEELPPGPPGPDEDIPF